MSGETQKNTPNGAGAAPQNVASGTASANSAPTWQATQPLTSALMVIDDLGEIGEGFCKAHTFTAENGQDYVAKGPILQPDHFYAAANEYVAYELSKCLGLPMLTGTLLQAGRDFFFGSPFMTRGSWQDRMNADLFRSCANLERVYDLVAFDVWLYNWDRHARNLLARRQGRGGSWWLLLNDHSHCLVEPTKNPGDLAARVTRGRPPELVQLPYVREEIRLLAPVRAAIQRVEAITDHTIGSVVGSLPVELMPLAERADVVRFISTRRDGLREAFAADRGFFTNLERGRL